MEKMPMHYLLLGMGIVGVISWCLAGTGWSVVLYVLLLLGPAIEDGRSGYISDGWSVLLAISGMVTSWEMHILPDVLCTVAGISILYGALWLIRREAIGMGDVFLSMASATWLTPLFGIFFLWISSMAALVFVGLACLWRRERGIYGIRFAPFIALGGGIAYGMQEMWGISLLASPWLSIG